MKTVVNRSQMLTDTDLKELVVKNEVKFIGYVSQLGHQKGILVRAPGCAFLRADITKNNVCTDGNVCLKDVSEWSNSILNLYVFDTKDELLAWLMD